MYTEAAVVRDDEEGWYRKLAQEPRPHQHLQRRKITTGIENNDGERKRYERRARLNVGGQAKGLQARGEGGENSELAGGKIHGNNAGRT